MYLFGYWMPTVLNLSGLTPEVAVFYASMFCSAASSCLVLGPGDRSLRRAESAGLQLRLRRHLHSRGRPLQSAGAHTAIPIFGAGAAMIGSQLGANAMVAALYPARIRSTGSAGRSASAGSAASRDPRSAAPCSAWACRRSKFPLRLRTGADRRDLHLHANMKAARNREAVAAAPRPRTA